MFNMFALEHFCVSVDFLKEKKQKSLFILVAKV